jgi:ABC-2 type transport system ATP-binding protein
MSDEVAVEVRNVSKRFRLFHEKQSTLKATILSGGRRARFEEFWALDDVSLDVPRGSTFALIGENGSGKSTLLKCMAKILVPDRGTIAVDGKLSALLELGAGFHAELSGRENVYLNGSILGLSKKQIDERFDDIVNFAGPEVERFIDTPVKNYSSGMFVRLGFAIAINVEPEVLLVDEILAVGDEAFQHKCTERFALLRSRGVTIVLVSHSLDAVRNMCDRAAWLEHGHLKEVGLSGHVVESYLTHVRAAREDAKEADEKPKPKVDDVIRGVELLDAAGRPTTVIRTGEPASFRFRLDLPADEDTKVLRLEFMRDDGMLVSAVSTRETSGTLDPYSGEQVVEYHIPRVLLGTGTYKLGVVLATRWVELARSDGALRFDVANGGLLHHGGYMLVGGDWEIVDTSLPQALPGS